MRRRLVVWVLASTAFGGCTFLTTFDPEGQPCAPMESNPELQCLSDAGYWCVDKVCKKAPPDGGG